MSKSVLVIAAHPDDEILGLGGTIRKHVLAGDTVHSVVMCEGTSVRYEGMDVPQRVHGHAAAEILGVTSFEMLSFPDQKLDTLNLMEVISPIEERVRKHQPQIVYTHFGQDLNRDHQILCEAVLVACRPVEPCVEAIYAYETPSSTEWNTPIRFVPNHFVDISETLETKLEAFACYESEVRPYPHPRSLQHLRHRAHYWGNLMYMHAAEAFVTYRTLWR